MELVNGKMIGDVFYQSGLSILLDYEEDKIGTYEKNTQGEIDAKYIKFGE